MRKNGLINRKEINKHSTFKSVSMGVWFLCFLVFFVFINKHQALFIAHDFIPLILFIAYVCLFRYEDTKLSPILISFGLLVFSSATHFDIFDSGTFFSYTIWLIVMGFSLENILKKEEISALMIAFILGSLVASVLVILQRHHYAYDGSFRFTIKVLNNDEIDPNYLASFLYIGVIFSLYKIHVQKKTKQKVLFFIAFIIIVFALFMTGSRAAYIAVACALLGYGVNVLKTTKHKIETLLAFVLIIVCCSLVVITKLSADTLERFNPKNLMDGSNIKRLAHWLAACKAFFKSPILGYGSAHTILILTKYANHVSDAHNTYLSILLHFGLIGSIPIIVLFFKTITAFVKKQDKEWLFYFMGFLFINLIIANHLGISFWLPLLVFYQISKKEEY